MKPQAVLVALLATFFSAANYANEEKETGQGRRAQKLVEEVKVYGVNLSKPVPFRAGLTNIVLVHEYNQRKNQWEFVKARDLSKEN